jgi:hypothetical protein
MDDLEKLMAPFGLKLINILPSAISSFVGLRFMDGMRALDRWAAFAGGFALAAWGAPSLREYVLLPPQVELLFVILLGFFGMSLTMEAIKVIRGTDWKAILVDVVTWIFRRKDGK